MSFQQNKNDEKSTNIEILDERISELFYHKELQLEIHLNCTAYSRPRSAVKWTLCHLASKNSSFFSNKYNRNMAAGGV